jgi:hypothetical protein
MEHKYKIRVLVRNERIILFVRMCWAFVIIAIDLGCLKSMYRLQKNSIPRRFEVIRGT